MKKLAGLVLLLAAVNLCAAPGMKIKGAGFGRLKTLVGEWEGTTENGARVRASYKLASNGTAILETLQTAGESEMITVYYRDADHLMLTHYCSEGNQPRMRTTATPGPDQSLDFSFVDVTNLDTSAEGHMRSLVVSFKDDDHFTQKWTWRAKGRDKVEVFRFTRKK